jgi:hypothetical protein
MAKHAEKSLAVEPPPARTRAAGRAAADRRLRLLKRLTTGITVAHIAPEEGLMVTRIRQILAAIRESREIDPPAGFVQIQIARLSEAMIVEIRLTDELARYHGFGEPPRRFAAAAPGRAARRIAGAVGSHDENFSGYKALKSHEMEKESVGWSIGHSESAIGADGGFSGRRVGSS